MFDKKGDRQGKGWPPPTQLSWFIKKGSRPDVVITKKGGRAGRGMATAHPGLMDQKKKEE